MVEHLHEFRTRTEIFGMSVDLSIAKHPDIEAQEKHIGGMFVSVFYRDWIPFHSEVMYL